MGKLSKQEEKGNRGRHLRDAAVKKLARTPGAAPKMKGKTPEELVHELQVHQIELEMQNEELKKAQLALEASRDKYVDLYDFAPVGYFTFTPGALIAEVNLTGAALLGVERQKLKNGRFRRFVAPEDLDRWDRHIVSVLQHGEKQSCDLVLKREGGFTFHARFDSIRLDLLTEKAGVSGGTPVVRTAVSDITERKEAEEALKESEMRFKAIFNESREGRLLAEIGTRRFFMCNPGICKMLGYTEEEMMHLRVDDIHPENDLPLVIEQFERQAKGEIKLAAGLPVKRKDGSIFYADVNTSPITLAGKKYLMGNFTDITDSKKIQDELKEKMQDLERFSKFAVDRELRMEELEKKIKELE
jgi:PAS domain S-box-containing protein